MNRSTKETIHAYIDLLRLQFGFAWPLLFCSGLFLAFASIGSIDLLTTLKAALIGFFGFEAGFVLNDYVDRELDRRDVENALTRYWRLYKERPLPSGRISPRAALTLFAVLVGITVALILTLPAPHSYYVLAVMIYAYSAEYFYQVVKRTEHYPIAQLVGRTDFALFPVAGYLVAGQPDLTALLYFLFFYPFAMAHLGANDLIDVNNDKARGMRSVAVLYGLQGTARWILAFLILHLVAAVVFAAHLGWVVLLGFIVGFALLTAATLRITRRPSPEATLRVLPFFHVTMIVYSLSLLVVSVMTLI